MKICDKHWKKLQDAVDARGLGQLVSRDDEEASAVLHRMMNDDVCDGSAKDYDPLLACTVMISNAAIELGGLYLVLEQNADGSEFCPICEVMKHMSGKPYEEDDSRIATPEELEEIWINGPSDEALEYCRQNGLVPPTQ